MRSVMAGLTTMLAVLGCGDDGTGPAPVDPTVATVTVQATRDSLFPTEIAELTAVVRLTDSAVAEDAAVTWSSSDNAVVQVDVNGVITAVAPGVAVVTAASGGTFGTRRVSVADGFIVDAVAVGDAFTCALARGAVYCWGRGDQAQTGPEQRLFTTTPTRLELGGSAAGVQAGAEHACAVLEDGSARCWGNSRNGRLGAGADTLMQPVTVSGGHTWREVWLGVRHTCGITVEDAAWCWGFPAEGMLGDSQRMFVRAEPVPVASPLAFSRLSLTDEATCAVATDGAVWCWGRLGAGYPRVDSFVPVRQDGGFTYTAIEVSSGDAALQGTVDAGGGAHVCGRTPEGRVRCWGYDAAGQQGRGTTAYHRPEPAFVPLAATVDELSLAWQRTCAVGTSGELYCWGRRPDGSTVPSADRLGVGDTWRSVATAAGFSCAITRRGALYCWGDNDYGQVGDGTRIPRSEPVRVRFPR